MEKEEQLYKEMIRKMDLAGLRAQYDSEVKYLLSEKIILAHIIAGVITEFKGMEPERIVSYIEGTPEVATVPVPPGETNRYSGTAICGDNTESNIPGEGTYTFDIKFALGLPEGSREFQLLINVEAQKAEPSKYTIPERGAFYVARMLSSQYGEVFTGEEFQKLKKVYSIWLVLNCPEKRGNTITRYYTERESLLGKVPTEERYQLSEIIVIRLSKKLAKAEKEELKLHRFLGTIFSGKMSPEQKKEILRNEYNVPIAADMRRRVSEVCNLSEAIEEEAEKRGEKRGIALGARNKLRELVERKIAKGKSLEVIADELEEDIVVIRDIYEEIIKN
ncbi:MAG: hypothetical protein J6J42_09355 [Lachnospiraceae bacterium]|nr:hypothetical protein [Lachnospiraceae bacterium]